MKLFPVVSYRDNKYFEKWRNPEGWGLYTWDKELIDLNYEQHLTPFQTFHTLFHEYIHHLISKIPMTVRGLELQIFLDNLLDKVDDW